MSQSTLDDDELFSEAASEMRADVEEALDAARASLPDADSIWTVDADNALGVLNGLRSALDANGAADALRDAKKWYTMGQRADAFDDAADLEEEIEAVEDLLETIADARDEVSDLAATLPELRGELESANADDVDDEDGSSDESEDD